MKITSDMILYVFCLVLMADGLAVLTLHTLGQNLPYPSVRPSVRRQHSGITAGVLFSVLLVYGLFLGGYMVLRYNGFWTERDSTSITLAIESIRRQATLFPSGWEYPHGFAYQIVVLALLSTTGLSTQTLQASLLPYLAPVGLLIAAYAFFRALTRSRRAALLASLFLVFQPDVLFVILRGSHEKILWPCMLVALMLLYQSIGQPLRKMIIYVGLFYAMAFAMIATNSFFGSVFLMAIFLSMSLGLLLHRWSRGGLHTFPSSDLQRLAYVSLSGGILVFFFIAYLYPPAASNLRLLHTIFDQISVLMLNFEAEAQPYAYISSGWVNPQTYAALTAFTWILLAASFGEWLRRARKIFRGEAEPGLVENLDWLLYFGFAAQIAISILVDFSGVLASNLQLRLFPGFTIIACGLLARGVVRTFGSLQVSIGWRRVLLATAALCAAWFVGASVFKATNEPSLSNKWNFYTPKEVAVLQWTDQHLQGQSIWSGMDERLAMVFDMLFLLDSRSRNTYPYGDIVKGTRYVLSNANEFVLEARTDFPLLSVSSSDRVYDNGDVQLYRLPPDFSPSH